MPMPKHLEGKAVKFGEGQSRKGAGRPKKIYTTLKKSGYNKSQVKECFSVLSDCTKDELQALINNQDATSLEITVARAYLKAMSKGEYRLIKDIVEVFADKPTQRTETVEKKEPRSRDEILEELKELENKRNQSK